MSSLLQFTNTRKYLRTQITKQNNNIKDSLGDYSRSQKQQTLTKLQSIKLDLKKIDSDIQSLIWDESKEDNESTFNLELNTCESYEDKLFESISMLEESLRLDSNNVTQPIPAQNHFKPPIAPLPKYSGEEGEDLERFFCDFEAVMNKFSFSQYEMFIMLKDQLAGRASIIIASLERSKQSYQEAKDLLTCALASPLHQKYETIQRLLNLKMANNKDPYIFVSEMRMIGESF